MVRHVLKDGSVVKDISGLIVKVQDAQALYTLMMKINEDPKKVAKAQKR